MRAVVMCGGLGTRLRPLTLTTPKAMLPVAGRPVIDRLLEKLAEAGLQDVTLATGHLAEQIEDFVKSGERWGLRVDYVRQVQPMGTAGALSLLADKSQPVLVVNGDKVIELASDLAAMAAEDCTGHISNLVGCVPYKVHCGVVTLGCIDEKPTLMAVAGVYRLHAWCLRAAKPLQDMPDLLNTGHVVPREFGGYVLDIGTPESYKAACATLSS